MQTSAMVLQDKSRQDRVRYDEIQQSPIQAYALYREKREDGKKRDLTSYKISKPMMSSTVVRNVCDEV
jgi:hypothetical protein